ncbi:MAG: right-handed parallel beta-helix repeat-containing protein [Clostridia bacterium]|nr:right-handed parallel beta-helix repeat-containing protein [Clostridia bacterium]
MKFSYNSHDALKTTAELQRAIDAATDLGETLFVEAGEYIIGTLKIRKGTHLHLCGGAKILGSGRYEDYDANVRTFVDAVGRERGRALIYAENADGAKITGTGIIDGRGELSKTDSPPFLMRFVGGKNIELSGITVKNSAAWTVHLLNVDTMLIDGITVKSRGCPNNDGIDIDSSSHVTVRNCDISTGDDSVCIKSTTHKKCSDILVDGCKISSEWAALKLGTESIGDFENITFKGCEIYDTEGCGIKVVPTDGANLHNLLIEDITMKNTTGPIFISLGKRLRVYFEGDEPRSLGNIENVTLKNITADVIDAKGRPMNGNDYYVTYDGMWGAAKGCIVINGLPEKRVKNILIDTVRLKMPGGVSDYSRKIENIIEMDAHYPEFSVLGTLPASVAFLRHVENVNIKNISYELKAPDIREPFCLVDAENSQISE